MHDPLRRTLIKAISLISVLGDRSSRAWSATGIATGRVPGPDDALSSAAVAIDVIRFFNTLEAQHKCKAGCYASKSGLLGSPSTAQFLDRFLDSRVARQSGLGRNLYSSLDVTADEVIPGWTLALHTCMDQTSYTLSIHETGKGEYAAGDWAKSVLSSAVRVFASDEVGVIYEGKLRPEEVPALSSYRPRVEAYPTLTPCGLPESYTAWQRINSVVRRVAFATTQAEMPSALCVSCCGGTCRAEGQCVCFNCGRFTCAWCCFPFCSNCNSCDGPCACC